MIVGVFKAIFMSKPRLMFGCALIWFVFFPLKQNETNYEFKTNYSVFIVVLTFTVFVFILFSVKVNIS